MKVTLDDIFFILVKRRKFIVLTFVLFVFVGVVVALLLPVKYTSSATILPPQDEAGVELSFLSMISDFPVGIPSLPGLVRPGEIYLAMLRSRTVSDSVIEKLNLMEYFGMTSGTEARVKLAGLTDFDLTEESVLVVQATERSPELAQNIVSSYVEELDELNLKIKQKSAGDFREFLENRLHESEEDLKRAAENVRKFQTEHKVIALEEQTRTAIEGAATLRGEMAIREVELHLLEKSLDPTHPTLKKLQSELEEYQKQLDKIEKGAGLESDDYIIPFSEIPDLGMQYAFLTKDFEVYKAVYTLLTQQYEQAKIQEKKDLPTLRILDSPSLPDKRSKPQRRLIVMAAALLSILVSGFVVFFAEYLNQIKTADIERYEKIMQSWQTVRSDIGFKGKRRQT